MCSRSAHFADRSHTRADRLCGLTGCRICSHLASQYRFMAARITVAVCVLPVDALGSPRWLCLLMYCLCLLVDALWSSPHYSCSDTPPNAPLIILTRLGNSALWLGWLSRLLVLAPQCRFTAARITVAVCAPPVAQALCWALIAVALLADPLLVLACRCSPERLAGQSRMRFGLAAFDLACCYNARSCFLNIARTCFLMLVRAARHDSWLRPPGDV